MCLNIFNRETEKQEGHFVSSDVQGLAPDTTDCGLTVKLKKEGFKVVTGGIIDAPCRTEDPHLYNFVVLPGGCDDLWTSAVATG